MELFGLKNKDGKEYKLTILDIPQAPSQYRQIQVEPIEPEPTFKEGDWIIGKDYYNPSEPSRVIKIHGYYADLDMDDGLNFRWESGNGGSFWRLATLQEIEQHLKGICDEKYIGKIAKCLVLPTDDDEIIKFKRYFINEDKVWYKSKNGNEVCVYRQGKFAEVLPQESKELPETLEELKQLFDKFYNSNIITSPDRFLEEQGYKVD
jgi:hypothetical protein